MFAPRPRDAARQRFAIPGDRTVVCFGAESLDNQRKGFAHLLGALARLRSKQQVVGLVFGAGDLSRFGGELPELRSVGYLRDPEQLSEVYSAADLFVMPSLEDNSPQTGLEAMACGTPVVAFDVGGVPDYVRPRQTGLLARVADPVDLARRIDYLVMRPDELVRMGGQARRLIEQEFDFDRQAQKYLALYRSLRLSQSGSLRLAAA